METDKKQGSPYQRSLSEKDLERMGFHYPELALKVIDTINHSTNLKSIKGLKVENLKTGECSCVNSYDIEETEVYRWEFLRVFLSAHEFPFSFAETGHKAKEHNTDCLCFLNRVFIQTADEDVQFDIVWDADMGKMSLEESLEFHLKKGENEEPAKPEEEAPPHSATDPDPKPNDWWTAPINAKEVEEKEEEEHPRANPDPTMEEVDLRRSLSFCKDIFEKKCGLYGLSFSEMHLETLTDQLFMKATILKRRLTDRDKSKRLGFAFFEGIRDEFAAVVNYGVIALWQGGFGVQSLVPEAPIKFYTDQMKAALSLISEKGADYGELWRKLRIGTLADMIYTKVQRLKGIEDQYRFGSMTKEGYHKFAGDQYRDLINYGLFGVVRMTEIADFMAFEMEENETDEEEGYE